MTKFSQRHGHMPLKEAFQRETIDDRLRVKLWNVLKVAIWDQYDLQSYDQRVRQNTKKIDLLVQRIWFHLLVRDMDTLPQFKSDYRGRGAYDALKKYFFEAKWFEVYDFLETIATDDSQLLSDKVRSWINEELETHNSAYRFVGETITEITSEVEIAAIEEGLADAETPSKVHLETSLRMLSDRESPDYRNSVKESISAVEAACREIAELPSATLGDALRYVENLHPAFSKAFGALYGYTSDASGIRHALTHEPTVTYADAKFMLVACAAFVSYIRASLKSVKPIKAK